MSRPPHAVRRSLPGIAVALASVAAATALTAALWPFVRPTATPLFFAAVVVSSRFGALGHMGAAVTAVGSARAALDAVNHATPDVMVSDIRMPGEDGDAFIRKLRALSPERRGRTPAVALTAYPRVEDRARALEAGFQMHVPKPEPPDELAALVAALAGRTRAA